MKTIKKCSAIIIAFILIISCVPIASAYEQYGDFEYFIENGYIVLNKYKGNNSTVSIPDKIEDIPVKKTLQTFYKNANLETVRLPDSLEEVGPFTFYNCSKLKNVTFGNNTITIGSSAFNHNTSLEHITIPESVTTIGSSAFQDCIALNNVVIPENVINLYACAFQGCVSLNDIKLNNKIEILSAGVFGGCTSLKKIDLPASIKSIYGGAFNGCTALEEFIVPDTVTSVGGCFKGCTSLKKVVFPEGIPAIYESTFEGCSSLTNFKIPDSVTEICCNAFKNSAIESINIPENVTSIGQESFYNCKNLKEIHIPSSVKNVYRLAFFGCSSLEKATIEEGLEFLGDGAFAECNVLKKVSLPSTLKLNEKECFMRCRKLEEVTIPEKTTVIGDSLFEDCWALKSINIPSGVTKIGKRAFIGCQSLKEIDIPDSVTSCGNELFAHCFNLERITLSENITAITDWMFDGCISLKKLNLSKKIRLIGDYAFESCKSLTDIYIPNTKVSFHKNCRLGKFDSASVVNNLMIYGYSGSTAEKYALDNNISFTDLSTDISQYDTVINLESDTIELDQYHQKQIGFTVENSCGATRFESTDRNIVDVDKDGVIYGIEEGTAYIALTNGQATTTVKVIVKKAEVDIKNEQQNSDYKFFYVEDENRNVYVKISEYIGANADVVIPTDINGYPVKVIGEGAFAEKQKMTSVIIPEGVEKLEHGAFYNCQNLKSVKFPSTIKTVEENIFSGKYAEWQFSFEKVEFPSIEALFNYIRLAGDNLRFSFPGKNLYKLYIDGKELTSVEFPEGTTQINDYTFYNCKSLENVTLPIGIEKIGENAFGNCVSLKSVEFPASLTEIGNSAFSGCTSITEAVLPEYLKQLGRYALSNTGIKTITFPENTLVGGYACSNCAKLETVFFNSKELAESHYGIVSGCDSLKIFNVGYNAADLDEDIVQGITNVPKFIGYYNNDIFMVCKRHNWEFVPLPYPWEEVESTGSDVDPIPAQPDFLYDESTDTYTITDKDGAIKGSEQVYPSREAFYASNVVFDYEKEAKITNWCTQWFNNIESLVVKGNIVEITDNAFMNFGPGVALESIDLSDNVKTIGNGAFINCDNLTEIKGCKGLKTIGYQAFFKCTGLKNINFASSVETIGYSAFEGCSGLSDLEIPESVQKISDYAFVNCKRIEKVKIPSSVTEIGKYAFGYLYNSEQDEYYPIPGFTIVTDKDSAAEKYALENDFKIVYINGATTSEPTEPTTEYVSQPVVTEPQTTDPAATVTEPVNTQPTTEKPSQPVVTEPQTTDPAATVTEPVTTEPAKTEPSKNTNTAVKKTNPVKISVTAKTVSAKKLKKKAQKIKPLTVKNAKGKLSYKLIKKGSAAKLFKKTRINSKGFITIKKGKYTKKTYKLKLRITVKGTQKYKPKTITKTVRIRIK